EFALLDVSAAAEICRLRQRTGRPIETAKVLLDLGDHGAMLNPAGGCDYDIRGAIISAEISAQLAAVERAHRLRRAQDGAAERLIGKSDRLQVLENEIVGRVRDGADLLNDYVLFPQELLAITGRAREDIGDHPRRPRHVGFWQRRLI